MTQTTKKHLKDMEPKNNYRNPRIFIERMERKLEIKKALYVDGTNHRFIDDLNWLGLEDNNYRPV